MLHAPTHRPSPLAHLEDALSELQARGLRRRPHEPTSGDALGFCSNDYLGLAGTFAPGVAAGAGASRLVAGERNEHRALEEAVARWLDAEACLAFTSGYAANVGAISALAAPSDLIVSDALNHASIIDGARLSKARVVVTRHNVIEDIERALVGRKEARAWVLVESYYGMDADGPALGALRELCTRQGAALYIDEAHALGVLGPDGRGLAAAAGVIPDVLVGTLGKAFGSQGAFVVGTKLLREWLWNRARSFVYSTGLSPAAAEAGRLALEQSLRQPSLRENVRARAAQLRRGLGRIGFDVLGYGHVVPLLVGSAEDSIQLSSSLATQGIVVPPIRPPTVPEGTARLRLTVTARHAEADIDRLLDALSLAHANGGM